VVKGLGQTHHNHRHRHINESWRRLSVVLALTTCYMFAEIAGAWWTGSLALLADAVTRRTVKPSTKIFSLQDATAC
jgi:Co/Zn/Cd efflux system component